MSLIREPHVEFDALYLPLVQFDTQGIDDDRRRMNCRVVLPEFTSHAAHEVVQLVAEDAYIQISFTLKIAHVISPNPER
jgi:hypothetical protein